MGILHGLTKLAAALGLLLALVACSDVGTSVPGVSMARLQPETVRPGLTAEEAKTLAPLRNGTRFTWQLDKRGSDLSMDLELRSRRIGGGYLLAGNLAVPLPGDNLQEIAATLEKVTKRRVRIRGNKALLPASLKTDRALRVREYKLFGPPVRHEPHDCFAVLGTCKTRTINAKGTQSRHLLVTTTESGGRWTSVSRLDPAHHGGRRTVLKAEVYSLDRYGMFLDYNYLDIEDRDRFPLTIRRK